MNHAGSRPGRRSDLELRNVDLGKHSCLGVHNLELATRRVEGYNLEIMRNTLVGLFTILSPQMPTESGGLIMSSSN